MNFFVANDASEFEHVFRNIECHGSTKRRMEIRVSRFQYLRTVNFSLGRTQGKEIPRKFRRGWYYNVKFVL
jgi:hypothetical protein